MEHTLEERAEKEIPRLSRGENLLNLARHLPLMYIPASAIAKPILLYNQNPVEYWTQDPVSATMMGAGLVVAGIGGFLKSTNDEGEMQTICANIRNEDNQEMVETGMYKHTRHPCYVGQTLMAVGFSLLSPAVDTAVALASYLGLTQKCAKAEERKNIAQFGEKYERYMDKVPRWPKLSKIPKLLESAGEFFSGNDKNYETKKP
jgi:protein-S-isoprenylcysteine O-methyltransferase Ste14